MPRKADADERLPEDVRPHIERFYGRQFADYLKHPAPLPEEDERKWRRFEDLFRKEVQLTFDGLGSSLGAENIIRMLGNTLGISPELIAELRESATLPPAERFKLAMSVVLAQKDVAYNRDATNVYRQIGLGESRARLQCTSGSRVSVAMLLSMDPGAIRSIEQGGRLVFVRSAIGPHMQWGIWKESAGGFELQLFESTAMGVASIVLKTREQLREYHIQSVTDAREQMRLLGKPSETFLPQTFYADSLPDEKIVLPEGDLVMPHIGKGKLDPIQQEEIIRMTHGQRAQPPRDTVPRE